MPQREACFWKSPSSALTSPVSEDLRRMLGYSIHPPFVGMVDGMHPKRLLDRR
ncbi:hypothetical protein [Streptomyces tailanensis]|uniref:hypothetical protein n=1 Tax=Streptomyces tailanensis TaxID=2569858 RepID=UPI001FEC430C|nr:hypothetical protein [Streptomyces tailanensis]